MLFYLILIICSFLVVLIIRVKRRTLYNLATSSVGLLNELMANEENDHQILVIQKRTNLLVVSLLRFFLLILIALAAGATPLFIYFGTSGMFVYNVSFSSIQSILSISIGSTIAFILPIDKRSVSSYSEPSQLLHHLALDNYNLAEKLFKVEKDKFKKKSLPFRDEFIVISGLARAGTTSLMNNLAQLEEFSSLSYANMPFLLSPNIWGKIYRPKRNSLHERSHEDGIQIGYATNEALEEYFFKVKSSDSYIHEAHLAEYNLSETEYLDYMIYQGIVKMHRDRIYLTKNNNYILRYHSMRSFNSSFLMVLLFRDPLSHASSLLEMHKHYTKLQKEDPFVLDYMNWLGHHEFGTNHKPFLFRNAEFSSQEDKLSINYWLEIWIYYYKYVIEIDNPNTIFIDYQQYCDEPQLVVDSILDHIGVRKSSFQIQPFNNTRKVADSANPDICSQAQDLYLELRAKSNYL